MLLLFIHMQNIHLFDTLKIVIPENDPFGIHNRYPFTTQYMKLFLNQQEVAVEHMIHNAHTSLYSYAKLYILTFKTLLI